MRIQTLRILSLGFVFATCCACYGAFAQEASPYPEYAMYQEASGGLSALFRGRQATRYQTRYNGHFYWSSPEYRTGDITYEGRVYRDITMNIDAVQQEVLVRADGSAVSIAVPARDIQSFNMGDDRFIGTPTANGLGLEDGLYEVLHEGSRATLCRKVTKSLTSSPNSANGSGIGYDDPDYDSNILTYFSYKRTLYLIKDGQAPVVIRSRGAFRRQFKEDRKRINATVNELNLDAPAVYSLDSYCKEVLDRIDQ